MCLPIAAQPLRRIITAGSVVSPFMAFPQFMRLTIAAVVTLNAITYIPAQTSRADDTDTGSTITSLTQPTHPRRAGTALDAIQGGAGGTVDSDLLQTNQMADAAMGGNLQSGGGSGHARTTSSLSFLPSPSGPMNGRASAKSTASGASPRSSLSRMLQPSSLQSPAPAGVAQGSSLPAAHPGPATSGLPLSTKSQIGQNHPPRPGGSRTALASDAAAGAPVGKSRSSGDESGSLAGQSSGTGAAHGESSSFFEHFAAPFDTIQGKAFEHAGSGLGETTCGEACSSLAGVSTESSNSGSDETGPADRNHSGSSSQGLFSRRGHSSRQDKRRGADVRKPAARRSLTESEPDSRK